MPFYIRRVVRDENQFHTISHSEFVKLYAKYLSTDDELRVVILPPSGRTKAPGSKKKRKRCIQTSRIARAKTIEKKPNKRKRDSQK